MNKRVIIGIVGVGAAAGIAYFLYKNSKVPAPATPNGPVNTVVNAVKNITSTVQQAVTNTTPGQYEGKLVRIAKDKVYLVKDNLLRYVSKLNTAGWSKIIELKSLNLPQGPALTDNELKANGFQGLGNLGETDIQMAI
jgi:hypothetical protein